MQPTGPTSAERLKGTLFVLVWVALALLLRSSWTSDRPALPGDVDIRARTASR